MISQLCQKSKVYFVIWDTTVKDPDIKAMLEANPYFVGTTNEDQITAGYDSCAAVDNHSKSQHHIFFRKIFFSCNERMIQAQTYTGDYYHHSKNYYFPAVIIF